MKAILTGHTRGLGAAIAEELLSRGAAVLGLARAGNHALAARYPRLLRELSVDLSNPEALARTLAEGALRDFSVGAEPLLLINNAGMLQPVGPVAMQDTAAIARSVSLNVAAPLMLSAAVAALAAGRELRILHVSSGAARSAYAGWSVYCAGKAALDQHARAVALDASPGVKICSLAPGVVDTDMQGEIRATASERFPLLGRFIDMKREGKLASPAEAARQLVAYLLSPAYGTAPVADLRDLP